MTLENFCIVVTNEGNGNDICDIKGAVRDNVDWRKDDLWLWRKHAVIRQWQCVLQDLATINPSPTLATHRTENNLAVSDEMDVQLAIISVVISTGQY